jgi:glycerophosphoryl diester phosphodiesterase
MVNIDKGYDYFKEAYAILEKTGTVNQCIMKSDHTYEKVKEENGEVLNKMVFMPVVNLHKEGAEEIIDNYIKNLHPQAFELVFNNDSPEILKLIKKVKDSGSRIFINTLWPELCGGHDDDRAVELKEPEESWGWVIKQGAKLIQTDRPELLLEYLRFNRLHR